MCSILARRIRFIYEDDDLVYWDHGTKYQVQGTRVKGHVTRVDAGCSSGKDAYPTYADAKRAYKLKNGTGQREKCIYKCSECGCWHFFTKNGKIRVKPYSRRPFMPVVEEPEIKPKTGNSVPNRYKKSLVHSVGLMNYYRQPHSGYTIGSLLESQYTRINPAQ